MLSPFIPLLVFFWILAFLFYYLEKPYKPPQSRQQTWFETLFFEHLFADAYNQYRFILTILKWITLVVALFATILFFWFA